MIIGLNPKGAAVTSWTDVVILKVLDFGLFFLLLYLLWWRLESAHPLC